MKCRLRLAVSITSACLSLLAFTLWMRGYLVSDTWYWLTHVDRQPVYNLFISANGRFQYQRNRYLEGGDGTEDKFFGDSFLGIRHGTHDAYFRWKGVVPGLTRFHWNQVNRTRGMPIEYRVIASIPPWPVVVLFGIGPSVHYLTFVRQRRHERLRALAGKCGRCGYNLCATPDRCPECGTVPRKSPHMTA